MLVCMSVLSQHSGCSLSALMMISRSQDELFLIFYCVTICNYTVLNLEYNIVVRGIEEGMYATTIQLRRSKKELKK